MGRTIDRQAAIDALCDNCDHVEAVCPHYPCKQYIAIENLPPAQSEIVRCKDCKHRIVNKNVGKPGYLNLEAMCELDTGDVFELGRNAFDDNWFCADAERREDE